MQERTERRVTPERRVILNSLPVGDTFQMKSSAGPILTFVVTGKLAGWVTVRMIEQAPDFGGWLLRNEFILPGFQKVGQT